MPDTSGARRAYRRLAYLLGPAMLLAGFATGGVAQAVGTARPAVPAPGAARCSVQPARTSVRRPRHAPAGGTILIKPSSSGCLDLNLYSVSVTDDYMGWLRVGGTWKPCGTWVHRRARSPRLTPLCAGVPAGTSMRVVAKRHALVPVIVMI